MSKRRVERALAGAALLFAALGDPTRLALLQRLSAGGPASISVLADASHITRQGVTKHLHVLAGAGVIDGSGGAANTSGRSIRPAWPRRAGTSRSSPAAGTMPWRVESPPRGVTPPFVGRHDAGDRFRASKSPALRLFTQSHAAGVQSVEGVTRLTIRRRREAPRDAFRSSTCRYSDAVSPESPSDSAATAEECHPDSVCGLVHASWRYRASCD